MRPLTQTYLGGILAGVLVMGALVSCSPGALPATDSRASSVENPGVQNTAPGDPADVAGPAVAPVVQREAVAAAERAGIVVVDEVEPVTTPKTLRKTPATIPVNGNVVVVHGESQDQVPAEELAKLESRDDAAAPPAPGTLDGGVWLATDEGALLPLADDVLGESAETGQEFAGEVVLSGAAQEMIESRIATAGDLPTATALSETASIATQGGESVIVSGAVSAPTTAAATVTKRHSAYVFYVPAYPARSEASITNIISDTGTYWKNQSDGKVSGLTIKGYKRGSTSLARYACDFSGLWEYAAKQFGHSPNFFMKDGRHLFVFVDSGCGSGTAGLGTIGSLHRGGLVWVDLYYKKDLDVSAHEMGHNMGLAHSQVRICGASGLTGRIDSATSWQWEGRPFQAQKPATSPCRDVEYNDYWSVMGGAFVAKPPALTIPQKEAIGILKSGSMKRVSTAGGVTQEFDLAPSGLNAGLMGLKVATSGSGTLYVEYRTSAGQDSGLNLNGPGEFYDLNGGSYGYLREGVRVLKSYPKDRYRHQKKWHSRNYARSTVLAARDTLNSDAGHVGQVEGLRPGQTLLPQGNAVRFTVLSSDAASSKVRVEYRGFRNGGRTVSTSVVEGGTLIAGKALKATLGGAWVTTYGTPSTIIDRYQWYRNGVAIPGATKSSYRTTAADAGKSVSVRVRPQATGYVPGSGAVSAAQPVTPSIYSDILWGHPNYTAISQMKSKGIATGAAFNPSGAMNRLTTALFLWNHPSTDRSFQPPTKSPFADVATSHPYYTQITYAKSKGFIPGTKVGSRTYFTSTTVMNRQGMAFVLHQFAGAPTPATLTGPSPFADVTKNAASPTYRAVLWMYERGIYTGAKQGTKRYFSPTTTVKRETFAVYLYRLEN